jgi:hypothetical protein
MIAVRKISHASYETPDLDKQAEYYTNVSSSGQNRRSTIIRMPSHDRRKAMGAVEYS